MDYSVKTPILIIAFNRPDTLKKVLEAVKKVSPAKLYLAMDGPRKEKAGEFNKYNEVKKIFETIDWAKNIYKKFRIHNAGCKKNVSEAINWAFENEGRLIILEDDIVPSVSFFRFCDELLEYYQENKKVMQICGYNVLQNYEGTKNSYYFTNYPVISGWATWKRAWNVFDYNLSYMENKDVKRKIISGFKKKKHKIYRYLSIKNTYKRSKIDRSDSWAAAWVFSILYNNGVGVMPKKNLARNIGFGEDAHNKGRISSPFARPFAEEIDFPLIHPKEVKVDMDADAETLEVHFKNGYPYWYVYLGMIYRSITINRKWALVEKIKKLLKRKGLI